MNFNISIFLWPTLVYLLSDMFFESFVDRKFFRNNQTKAYSINKNGFIFTLMKTFIFTLTCLKSFLFYILLAVLFLSNLGFREGLENRGVPKNNIPKGDEDLYILKL